MTERCALEVAAALALLPEGNTVHTFRQAGNVLIGADSPRDAVEAAMHKYGVELSGETATSMGHGIVLCDDVGWLFIQTRK